MEKKNLTVVITGASSGIGRATALAFAKKGYNLALAARRLEALEEVVKECENAGGKAFARALDVTKEEEVETLASLAYEKYKSLDVWVNNAGVLIMGPFEETPMEDIKRLMDVNVNGYFHGARAALRYFRKQGGGTLINVSCVVGMSSQPFAIAYATSRAATRGMSLSLQQEYANEKNIHICTVLPATIDTPIFKSAANYMGKEVKAMKPVVDAHQVADEIVNLVKNPKPQVIVGGMGIQLNLMQQFTPGLFAKMFHKQVKSMHFKDTLAVNSKGNLYEPDKAMASIDGGWLNGEKSRTISMQVRNTLWMSAGLFAAMAGAAAYFLGSKHARK